MGMGMCGVLWAAWSVWLVIVGESECHAAYMVYVLSCASRIALSRPQAPNLDAGDEFGYHLSLKSDTLAVGALGEDSC